MTSVHRWWRSARFFWVTVAFGAAYALWLRWLLMRALPDPIIFPDSHSYLHPLLTLLGEGRFALDAQRTPVYPLFLLAIVAPLRHLSWVVGVQHLLSLGTAILSAVLFYRVFRSSRW